MDQVNHHIAQALQLRKVAGNYRQLKLNNGLIDFCSNDYLGFARSAHLAAIIEREVDAQYSINNGSGGSRLLAGNTPFAQQLESAIAEQHGFESALLYNSGYDANVGLFSCLPQRGDTVVTDELIHASIIDGIRLSNANRYTFKHNDLLSLEEKLRLAKGRVYVAVESVYSMDGDTAPLPAIAKIAQDYGAALIVDEAHATGVFGHGLIEHLHLQDKVFAKIVTYGKAMGCHGAAVLGRDLLQQYLINFSRSFIYTTAAPLHQLAAIKSAYQLLAQDDSAQLTLQQNILDFKALIAKNANLIPADGPIQCLIVGSSDSALQLSQYLQSNNLDVRPILSPTVAEGFERIRICLHAYNTAEEIADLTQLINSYIKK